MSKIRTRLAPSPTGFMHVGNLRTAIFAFFAAKHNDGDFILRIEDTDRERKVDGAEDVIYNTLKSANLQYDEGPDVGGEFGPYVQSERVSKDIYNKYAMQLIEQKDAYYCFCKKGEECNKKCLSLSSEQINKNLNDGVSHVIRQNNPNQGFTFYRDEVFGKISVPNSELEDMVLIKSDGWPPYGFAVVIDDHLMGINLVMRGVEYLSSTPKYIRLYESLGFPVPKFAHCPLIVDTDGKKLSKRHGAATYSDLIAQGYMPEAIVNYIALLGWSPEGNEEIMSMAELIEKFDYTRISKSPAVFDVDKLNWMNSHYMMSSDLDTLLELSRKFIAGGILADKGDDWLKEALNLFRSRANTIAQLIAMIEELVKDLIKNEDDIAEFLNGEHVNIVLGSFLKATVDADFSDLASIKSCFKATQKETGFKGKQLFMTIRVALTGSHKGADLNEVMKLLGKDTVALRLSSAFI